MHMPKSYRDYVVVPRDVPPENFQRVPALKKQKTSVRDRFRNILFIFLFLCAAVGGVSGVYLFFSNSVDDVTQGPEAVDYLVRGQGESDHHEKSYRAVLTSDRRTVYIRDRVSVSSVEPCLSSPCQGGGTCEAHDGTFTCHCNPGSGGRTCQHTGAGARLGGRSRIVLNTDLGQSRVASITLRLRPEAGDGIILRSGDLSLSLVSGKLQLQFGGESFSYESVRAGEWSEVGVSVYHRDVRLHTGPHPPLTLSLGPASPRVLGDSLCLGWCEPGGRGLPGCLGDLRLGHAHISLLGPGVRERRGVETCGHQ